MAKLQMQDTLTKLEQMCIQYDPTITLRSTSKKPNPVAEMESIMQNIPTC